MNSTHINEIKPTSSTREMTGTVLTMPEEINGLSKMTVHCMVMDRNKMKYRLCTHSAAATKLLNIKIGDKVKIFGTVKPLVEEVAYLGARRQITSISIQIK